VSSVSFLNYPQTDGFLLIPRCQECGYIAEENILVSEVGFAEGAGGRVHVQGAFVSHGSSMFISVFMDGADE
jgi:hypothetical protein